MLKLGNKTAKTNPEKVQLFAESVERNFCIESHLFRKSQFDRTDKFVEPHSYHFTPLDSIHDSIADTDDDSDLVADVDPDTLIQIVRTELKPSQTTSYRSISLLSAIMKLFEWVMEKRLRKHLEGNGFFRKYQSGFRKSKSTNDHLFRLSQTIMESFNRRPS